MKYYKEIGYLNIGAAIFNLWLYMTFGDWINLVCFVVSGVIGGIILFKK